MGVGCHKFKCRALPFVRLKLLSCATQQDRNALISHTILYHIAGLQAYAIPLLSMQCHLVKKTGLLRNVQFRFLFLFLRYHLTNRKKALVVRKYSTLKSTRRHIDERDAKVFCLLSRNCLHLCFRSSDSRYYKFQRNCCRSGSAQFRSVRSIRRFTSDYKRNQQNEGNF